MCSRPFPADGHVGQNVWVRGFRIGSGSRFGVRSWILTFQWSGRGFVVQLNTSEGKLG